MKHPKVIAPCVNMTKVDLINYALNNNMDLKLIKSCYQGAEKTQKKHCAKCMSCKLLYNAIKNSNKPELIKEIF
jgi:7-cyano-7-deazaguanine synthase in queuosine biosynthesis